MPAVRAGGKETGVTEDEGIEAVARRAQETGRRVGVAESLTCGLLATTIGKGESASDWFAGGVVAYGMDVKEHVLGVPSGIDPCSAECAEHLAKGARALLGTDVAVSTTGVGGPDPENGHEPGTVFLGWATAEASGSRLLELDGDPEDILSGTVDEAVGLLAGLLAGADGADPQKD